MSHHLPNASRRSLTNLRYSKDSITSPVELNEQLLSQLECPVCFKTCMPPIYMCCNGHSVCAECQPQLKTCSTCRALGKPTARSVQLEKIAALLKIPCKNQPHGCKNVFNMDEMAKHLPKCDFGFKCKICTVWKGSVHDLKDHVQRCHYNFYNYCSSTDTKNLISKPVTKTFHWLKGGTELMTEYQLFVFNNDIFWLQNKFNPEIKAFFYSSLQIVSQEVKFGMCYYYSIELKSKDDESEIVFQQRKVLTKGDSGNMYIVIPMSIGDSFKDDCIWYTIKISLLPIEYKSLNLNFNGPWTGSLGTLGTYGTPHVEFGTSSCMAVPASETNATSGLGASLVLQKK